MINIPSAVKRGEVEYCVIQLDYNILIVEETKEGLNSARATYTNYE